MSVIAPGLCGVEDRRGRVCRLGQAHASKHRFGDTRLTSRQLILLQKVAENPRHEFFAPCGLSALERLGLIYRRFIGQRWWYATCTPAGLLVVQEASN
jgi:hypothetical protein